MSNDYNADKTLASPKTDARRWYAVAILILLYVLSFTDRMIISLLAPEIRAEFHISNTELGLLFGTGFGVLYSLVGLPLAHLIDKGRRVRIVMIGVTLWSLCTIASGFANTTLELLVLRSGVALGEAVLSPAAVSIIGDLFERNKRALPTTLYNAVAMMMGTGAFVAGGAALDLATKIDSSFAMEPWRLTLVLVGLPGLLLAPLFFFTVREPPRTDDDTKGEFATAREAWGYFLVERWLFGLLFLAMGSIAIVTASFMAWVPTILIREYGMVATKAGYIYGTVGAITGTLSALFIPTVIAWWTKRRGPDAVVVLLAGGMALVSICGVAAGLVRTPQLMLTALAGLAIAHSATVIVPPLMVQYVTPGRMRGRIIAGGLLANNLIGFAIGPALTAWIAERFLEPPFALAKALIIVSAMFGPVATVAVLMLRKQYLLAYQSAERRDATMAAPPAA